MDDGSEIGVHAPTVAAVTVIKHESDAAAPACGSGIRERSPWQWQWQRHPRENRETEIGKLTTYGRCVADGDLGLGISNSKKAQIKQG
jgi:hypothetical protein